MRRSLWVLVLALPWLALAQQKDSRAEPGVDWEAGVLRARGLGAPDLKASNPRQARLGAERSARQNVWRDLVERARGIRISADRTVGDELARDEVRGRVEKALGGYTVSKLHYYSDSGVELVVELPLAALASAVVPAADKPLPLNTQGPEKYTGLVVDARALKAKPVLAPRLLDASGKPLHGLEAPAWFSDLEKAKEASRVGAEPLVVKAVKLQGSDLVLSEEGAKQLAEANTRFLAEGRVIIVTR